jgi:uncharacterized protein with von Willebrand factor type A (vWA) domain
VISPSIDDFHFLSKATLVKDETKFDRFDFAFAEYFKGVSELVDLKTAIPEDWLEKIVEIMLSPEERAKLEAMDFRTLMETLKKRLEEQQGRHQGGNKWVGTGGTSPRSPRRARSPVYKPLRCREAGRCNVSFWGFNSKADANGDHNGKRSDTSVVLRLSNFQSMRHGMNGVLANQ